MPGGDASSIRIDAWRAVIADDELRRDYMDPAYDASGWDAIDVPGHWRSSTAFAATDGPLLYRADFAGEALGTGGRHWLVLDGIFYTSDVWLDGGYLGDTEGYFFPHGFEITDQLRAADDHTLAIEVSCAPQRDRVRKRNITGVFQHWDLIDQAWNPGGIWRPVRVERSGPVRILHSRVLCQDANPEVATVFVRTVLDTVDSCAAEIVARVRRDGREVTEHRFSQPLAAGENRVEFTFPVQEPALWWPWSRGTQPLYDVEVAVTVEGADEPSDAVERRIGMRSVTVDDWIFSVNGERMYLKGANQGPAKFALAEATPGELARDVELAKEAGLDFLRLHAHVSRPEIYDAADAAGLLLWQDLPFQWGYHRSVRTEARRQARLAVDVLAHHPSVFVWCGHNEPMAIDVEPAAMADPKRRVSLFLKALGQQALPSWNKSVLDHSIKKVIEACDGSRPVIPHSGVLPHLPQLDGTDSHWYFGWYHGEVRDFERLVRTMPRTARFVSEFGAQAAPLDAPWASPERWPDLDWTALAQTYAAQKVFFDRYVPPDDSSSYRLWADATQRYQAELLKFHIETLRRVKYRPSGGFAMFCFADGAPGITWSVLDHARRPKLGYDALRAVCQPVIVTADWLPAEVQPGERLRLDIHVVNDTAIALGDMVVGAHLRWGSEEVEPGEERWYWQGGIPADDVVLVGTLDYRVPSNAGTAPGTVVLDLDLSGTGADGEPLAVTNRYTARVRS